LLVVGLFIGVAAGRFPACAEAETAVVAWIQFLLCETGRGRDVSELTNQAINRALVAFDCGAFVVGERDMREHPLQSAFGFEQLHFA
jgi:hypothetical protein